MSRYRNHNIQEVIFFPGMKLDCLEKLAILKTFQSYNQNKTQTSHALGISIRTLDAKLDKYEKEYLEQESKEEAEKQKREEFIRRQRGEGSFVLS